MICQRCKEQQAKADSIYCLPCKLIQDGRINDAFRKFCRKHKLNSREIVSRMMADICGTQPTNPRARELAQEYLKEITK